jgi:bifunctional non-homologous end joining protein LigD
VDLDPKEAPFAHVVRIARALRALCDDLGLPSFPKTTGQKGLHVLVPLGGQLTHAQSRTLGELLARTLEAELPDVATTARAVRARGGKVYLDFMQNGYGKTIAAPYAVRPRPGAPVSTPLRWSEVNARLDPARFTIRTVPARARRLGEDPLRPVLSGAPDLLAALERLRARSGGARPPRQSG